MTTDAGPDRRVRNVTRNAFSGLDRVFADHRPWLSGSRSFWPAASNRASRKRRRKVYPDPPRHLQELLNRLDRLESLLAATSRPWQIRPRRILIRAPKPAGDFYDNAKADLAKCRTAKRLLVDRDEYRTATIRSAIKDLERLLTDPPETPS